MIRKSFEIIPGLAIAIATTILGGYLSEIIGTQLFGFTKSPISPIIMAIIIGILLSNSFSLPKSSVKGFDFNLKYLLKIGIVLLGIRLGLYELMQFGVLSLPVIIICIISSITFVIFISKKIRIPHNLAILTAIGTSICGATAIVASAPLLGAQKEEITYAIANITVFGILAMILYPFLSPFIFPSNELAIGIFLGTAIHETAQVIGAALIFSENFISKDVIDVATVTKLVRNLMMVILIPLIPYLKSFSFRSEMKSKHQAKTHIPAFIIGFIVMVCLRTFVDFLMASDGIVLEQVFVDGWNRFIIIVEDGAKVLLTISMASIGLKTDIKSLLKLGFRPFYIGLTASILIGVISYFSIKVLI
tara:strand:+ start:78 stop:1163 length:1086 start_codon:yes stop_codon:yes gene_type:complete